MLRYALPFFRYFASLPVLIILLSSNLFAQTSKHGNIWYFGNGDGVDFTSGVPVKLSNINVDSYEGCSIYCDVNGQVQLYTNGGGYGPNTLNGPRDGIIWNRNQQVMYNMGATEGGGYSAAQSAVIVPANSGTPMFFVFTMDHKPNPLAQNRGLSYFKVDMSLNGGLGGVTSANVPVFKPATECLAAMNMNDGQADYWIVTVDRNSSDFVLVPLTAAGVGTPKLEPRVDTDEVLVIKASPSANYLCANGEIYEVGAPGGTLNFKEKVAASGYTFSFSPRSRYLYAFESDASGKLVRYDLLATGIAASQEVLLPETGITIPGQMQLGPDGNIYWIEQLEEDILALPPTVSLSVIRCPDGAAPQIERSIMKFDTDPDNGGGFFTSLPNFPDLIFIKTKDRVASQVALCDTSFITLKPAVPGLKYLWSNGETTPAITVNVPAGQTFTFSVRVDEACDYTYYDYEVTNPGNNTVRLDAPAIKDTCSAFPFTLRVLAPAGSTFKWSDGSVADTIRISDFGNYSVDVTTNCGTSTLSYSLQPPQGGCCHPFTPNAFTPNGDGVNDLFSPVLQGCDVEFLEFSVYSRWGELMYQGFSAGDRWDGMTLNGTEAPSDVYVYTARYKFAADAEEKTEKGDITLLR